MGRGLAPGFSLLASETNVPGGVWWVLGGQVWFRFLGSLGRLPLYFPRCE